MENTIENTVFILFDHNLLLNIV